MLSELDMLFTSWVLLRTGPTDSYYRDEAALALGAPAGGRGNRLSPGDARTRPGLAASSVPLTAAPAACYRSPGFTIPFEAG